MTANACLRIQIYADGSCSPNPGRGGWAAVLVSPSQNHARLEISGTEAHSTNNRMELTAAIEGLKAVKKPCIIDLHTDSKYVQQAFTQGWLENWQRTGWKNKKQEPVANQDLWKNLLKLTQVHKVYWHWVKGHSDCAENNRCDELAKQARQL